MNRRSFLKRMVAAVTAVVGLGSGSYVYAREIEPAWLHAHRETITSSKIPASFNNYKIVQFTDTHIGFQYTVDQLKTLVTKIHEENPDIIVFTGDLVDSPQTYHWGKDLTDTLKSLQAPDGKFWIYGNHDHGGYGTDKIKHVMDKSGFTLLQNKNVPVKKKQDEIILAGIDDVMLGSPDLNQTFRDVPQNTFAILLAHEPDFADQVVDYPADIQLSGHSHGGQVRLPFIGHLYTPVYAEKYVEGNFDITEDLKLYISNGIGTTRLPYRFFCRPEYNVYTLKTET